MLYEQWLQIAQQCAGQIALRDLAAGRTWTFEQLADAAEADPPCGEKVVFPSGTSAEFVLAVLRAWRSGQVVCPIERSHAAPEINAALPRGVVHLKTTSATTGAPQLVAFTAAQLMADARNIVATMGLRRDWPNLGVISLAHSYGYSNLVLALLLHGIPLILVGGVLPEALRCAAASGRELTLAAVPALWQAWHEANVIPANIRLAISAGAPLPLTLECAVFNQRHLKIHNFYGSSECGGIAYDTTREPRREESCAGTPLQGVQLCLAEDGCLEVRSQAVGETYWPAAKPNLAAGCYRTGDLAEIRSGHVYLCGRAGDQINVAGRKVLPETIERVLTAHPLVRDCLAFGVASGDGQRGEMIVACVAASEALTGEALRQFAMTNLPPWQVPRQWWFVESLTANSRGKLSRAEWRKRFLERTPG